jgi:hypothetical protein
MIEVRDGETLVMTSIDRAEIAYDVRHMDYFGFLEHAPVATEARF